MPDAYVRRQPAQNHMLHTAAYRHVVTKCSTGLDLGSPRGQLVRLARPSGHFVQRVCQAHAAYIRCSKAHVHSMTHPALLQVVSITWLFVGKP